jgi:diguanylate cyclase (GGDEF)-like protein
MRTWIENIAVAAAYWLLAAAVSVFLSAFGVFPAPFWPSAGVALAAALLGGRRLWPGIYLGSFCANWLLFGASPLLAAGISVTNVLAPAVGAALIRRSTQTRLPFFRIRHVADFILYGVVLHGLVAATGGVGQSVLSGAIPAADGYAAWWRWALSDGGGTLLFGPALMLWWIDRQVVLTPAQWLEAVGVLAVTLIFTTAVFLGIHSEVHSFVGLPYLLLAPLMWFTVRFSMRAGTTLLSTISLIAIAGTIASLGPFHLTGVERPLLGVGLMVVAMGITTLAVGALVSERRSAEVRLWELNETLEQRVAERTVELHRRATEDSLTGVANRAYFFELGEFALAHARRSGRPLTALMVDLDDLKNINDTWGHHEGDKAIAQLAEACRCSLRDSDLLGRVGGDEFAVLLPGVDATAAEAVVARIQGRLRIPPAGALDIRASIGFAGLLEADASLDDLLRRADAAMYAVKRQRTVNSPAAPG